MTFHRSNRRRFSLSVAFLALFATVSGCAQPVPDGGTPGPGPGTYGPDDVVIRIEHTGGFVPMERLVARLPILSVYGDGRVITQGPVIAIYPSPALPNLLVRTITPAGVDALVTRSLANGVGRDIDLGLPPVADALSTKFTVLTKDGVQVTEAYALGINDDGNSLSAAQKSARRALRDLLDDLNDLPKTLGSDAGDEPQPYQPAALAAISREWTDPGSTDIPAQPEKAWPGPTLPGDPLERNPALACVTVTGADVATVLSAAATANALTPWSSAGRRWLVQFRPLLPEESTCADLT